MEKIRILLVEDNPDDVDIMREMFMMANFQHIILTFANDLLSGIEKANSDDIDIVLLDLSLPDSEGMDTFLSMREQVPDIPIILLTGSHNLALGTRAVQQGAQDYLVKGQENANSIVRSIQYGIERFNLYRELDMVNKNMSRELEIAEKIQESIYPDKIFNRPGIAVVADIKQKGNVGGDYFDIFPLSEYKTAILIADVSGHDIASAFVVAMAKISFSAHITPDSSLEEIFQKVNRDIMAAIKSGLFMTAFLVVVDTEKGTLRYCAAGHGHQLLYRKNNQQVECISTQGFMLGAIDEDLFEEKNCKLAPGDKLILFTDGITESFNHTGEMFGNERLEEVVREHGMLNAADLHITIMTSHKDFCNGIKPEDDRSLLVIEYKAK
ncbi:MAG: fused response regulator/phosphatase [Fibrobacteria bacterium]|nr:fused response regulator/phosphatase [Fibrobacteria bacterium]